MPRARKAPFNGAPEAAFDHDHDGEPGGNVVSIKEVTVTVADMVSNGRGGYFAVGDVIPVTPEQAAGLLRQGFAK
jgi:hypothetical protein